MGWTLEMEGMERRNGNSLRRDGDRRKQTVRGRGIGRLLQDPKPAMTKACSKAVAAEVEEGVGGGDIMGSPGRREGAGALQDD